MGVESYPAWTASFFRNQRAPFDSRFTTLCQIRRVARFSRVSHLTIFVDDNAEDSDTTVIEKIQLLGSGGDSFNVAEIKDISKDQS